MSLVDLRRQNAIIIGDENIETDQLAAPSQPIKNIKPKLFSYLERIQPRTEWIDLLVRQTFC